MYKKMYEKLYKTFYNKIYILFTLNINEQNF